ncbi:MAG: winged helix-turn-helix transcriptional regulator [Thermoproteota archaeon]|nr:winged helix-turn-helix transcriptional regulator [Thermoproteota archaeon]
MFRYGIELFLETTLFLVFVLEVYSSEKPVRVEYQPTVKGLALQPIMDMMAAYSMKYCSKDVFKDAKPREFQEVYGREMAKVSSYA